MVEGFSCGFGCLVPNRDGSHKLGEMISYIDRQFGYYFAKQMNLQEIFCVKTLCKILKCLEKNWGIRLWITKWTLKKTIFFSVITNNLLLLPSMMD